MARCSERGGARRGSEEARAELRAELRAEPREEPREEPRVASICLVCAYLFILYLPLGCVHLLSPLLGRVFLSLNV